MSSLEVSGLPVINQAREPASVKDGSPVVQKDYREALGFEEMLLEQLSQSLIQSSGLEGEAGQGEASEDGEATSPSPASGELSALLPGALTSSLQSAGGLGMADQLMKQLSPASASVSAAKVAPSGGTSS